MNNETDAKMAFVNDFWSNYNSVDDKDFVTKMKSFLTEDVVLVCEDGSTTRGEPSVLFKMNKRRDEKFLPSMCIIGQVCKDKDPFKYTTTVYEKGIFVWKYTFLFARDKMAFQCIRREYNGYLMMSQLKKLIDFE